MFGITSAPKKYQQEVQQVLNDCSGTANISDDIIAYGSDTGEHNERLEESSKQVERQVFYTE